MGSGPEGNGLKINSQKILCEHHQATKEARVAMNPCRASLSSTQLEMSATPMSHNRSDQPGRRDGHCHRVTQQRQLKAKSLRLEGKSKHIPYPPSRGDRRSQSSGRQSVEQPDRFVPLHKSPTQDRRIWSAMTTLFPEAGACSSWHWGWQCGTCCSGAESPFRMHPLLHLYWSNFLHRLIRSPSPTAYKTLICSRSHPNTADNPAPDHVCCLHGMVLP